MQTKIIDANIAQYKNFKLPGRSVWRPALIDDTGICRIQSEISSIYIIADLYRVEMVNNRLLFYCTDHPPTYSCEVLVSFESETPEPDGIYITSRKTPKSEKMWEGKCKECGSEGHIKRKFITQMNPPTKMDKEFGIMDCPVCKGKKTFILYEVRTS